MLEEKIRPFFQPILIEPVAKLIVKYTPFSANIITALSCLVGLLVIPFAYCHWIFQAVCCLWLSGYLDILDGSVARISKSAGETGTVYDITSDRLVEFAVILSLFLIDPTARSLSCILMLGSVLVCVTSFLVVGLFIPNHSDKGFHYSPGLMERFEAFFLFTLMYLLPEHFALIANLFSALVFFTAARRLYCFQRNSKLICN